MGSKKPWVELTKRIKASGKSKGVTGASGLENNQDKLEKKDWFSRENYCQLKRKRGGGEKREGLQLGSLKGYKHTMFFNNNN